MSEQEDSLIVEHSQKSRGFGCETGNCGQDKDCDVCKITLSGTASCTETDLQVIYCWELLVTNCDCQSLGKSALSFDIRSFQTDAPFSIGPGIFASATFGISAESGITGTPNAAYAGTGVFYNVNALPLGSSTFTICAAFPIGTPNLCFTQISPAIFSLKSTVGNACRKPIQVSAFIDPPANCATCVIPHVFCDFTTVDGLERGAIYATNGKLNTNIPFASNDGITYEVTSFIINGVEQMGPAYFYTILNTNVTMTTLPNPNDALIFNQMGGFQYLANFNLVFGGLFTSLGLQANWQAILNPDFDVYGTVNVIRFIYPLSATNWSITLIRHDGTEYVYHSVGGQGYVTGSNGFDSRNTQYQYCESPQPIDLTITALTECYYIAWDITDEAKMNDIITNQGPITWTIKQFAINGISQFIGNYTYTISNVGQLTKTQPFDTFYNNNSVFLDQFFTSLGLQAYWSAETLNSTSLLITYPNNADEWVIVIERNNGDIYYYTQQGIVMNEQGYNSTNSNYAFMCIERPLGFQLLWGPVNYDYLSLDLDIGLESPSIPPSSSIQRGSRALIVPRARGKRLQEENATLRIQMRKEKDSKEITPLSVPPPKITSEISGLLYDRCLYVLEYLQSRFSGVRIELFVFGSQISGFSGSGKPDIDLWLVCEAIPKIETRPVIEQLTRDAKFKLDLTHIDRRVLTNRVSFVKFEKRVPQP